MTFCESAWSFACTWIDPMIYCEVLGQKWGSENPITPGIVRNYTKLISPKTKGWDDK